MKVTEKKFNVFVLYGDWRWTGPAELVFHTAISLALSGNKVHFAYHLSEIKTGKTIHERIQSLNVPINYITELYLNRRKHGISTFLTILKLSKFIRTSNFDVLHTNTTHDHIIAALAKILSGSRKIAIIRSLHYREAKEKSIFFKFLLRYGTNGLVVFSHQFKNFYVRYLKVSPDLITIQPLSVDLDRFKPHPTNFRLREMWNIPNTSLIIGTVGRFEQGYRRADLILHAFKILLQNYPDAYLWFVGSTSNTEKHIREPAAKLGINEKVIQTGYRFEDYPDVLRTLDIFTLLIPGSDGTARALREAMAVGKACVVSDYGMLPEIIQDGVTGLVCKLEPPDIAEKWIKIIRNPSLRSRLESAAAEYAMNNFRIENIAPTLELLYSKVSNKLSFDKQSVYRLIVHFGPSFILWNGYVY